jgi:hypothetical protein
MCCYSTLRLQHERAKEEGRAEEAALIRAAMTHHEDDAMTSAGLPTIWERILRWFCQ